MKKIRIGGNFEFYSTFCIIHKLTILSDFDTRFDSGVTTFRIIKVL